MNLPAFDKEGHRGCRGLMPENTLPAVLRALDLGVTTLEMDAMVTKDRKVILSHDPYFNPDITTRPDGSFFTAKEEKQYTIFNMTLEETQLYDVGLKPYPRFPKQQRIAATKPLLSEVIANADAYALLKQRPLPFYNIETKSKEGTDGINHPAPQEYVDLLMTIIKEKKVEERVIIQSFDPRTLQVVHHDHSGIKTALLIEDFDKRTLKDQLQQLGFTPTIYSPAYSLVTPVLISDCHRKKIKVIPWTVDDKKEIERLTHLGVDGIITDYPDLF
ncbi:MAG TPA: glycerophosphodiester phosphodiesterase family protein [Chitinophagaceae bacterium]|nr:glycerophosphodiester phosphodiesterase family protein [Chitinophagaceae bacterium]